jgi:hypothetical protein
MFRGGYNGTGEQRPEKIPSLQGLYVKPLSSRRLLQWHCYVFSVNFRFFDLLNINIF